MPSSKERNLITAIYDQFVVQPQLERRELLVALHKWEPTIKKVLYPGSFMHITPSFYFPHVIYVDKSDDAGKFFRDDKLVAFINANKIYPQNSYIQFLKRDFCLPLPLRDESFSLLLSLFAGGISRHCTRYLKRGGILVTNNHHQDAEDARACPELELEAVVREHGKRCDFVQGDLASFLTKRTSLTRKRYASSKKVVINYRQFADYYVFRKR